MNAHVRDALVDGYQTLIPALKLPDPEDCHVLAAAIQCRADLSLTFNFRAPRKINITLDSGTIPIMIC